MVWTWVPMVIAALIVGIAKTSFGGLGSIAVALLAFVMPTKESTAAALLLLIVGDIVAVLRYRSYADWGLLKGLLHGLTMPEAAKLGSVSASFCLEKMGTQEHEYTSEVFRQRYEATFGPMPEGILG